MRPRYSPELQRALEAESNALLDFNGAPEPVGELEPEKLNGNPAPAEDDLLEWETVRI